MLPAVAVAHQLGISQRAVYAAAEAGHLPCYRFGRAVRFDPADVEAFRASCRSVASKTARAARGAGCPVKLCA